MPEYLVIDAQGFYGTAASRDLLVQAVQTAVSANDLIQWERGQQWASNVPPSNPRTNVPTPVTYNVIYDLATFCSSIEVDVYSAPGTTAAHLDVTISLPGPDNGFCGTLDSALEGLDGAIAGPVWLHLLESSPLPALYKMPLLGIIDSFGVPCLPTRALVRQ